MLTRFIDRHLGKLAVITGAGYVALSVYSSWLAVS
jgi:hypothetical protein